MTDASRLAGGRGIWRRKPIEQISETEAGADEGLERSLGLWQLTAIGVGGIIGAGIFALAGEVAKSTAGPAVVISFLVAGVASAAAAFSYAGVRQPDPPSRLRLHLRLRRAR